MRFCARMQGYSADLLRFVEETASPSCSSQVRKAGAHVHSLPFLLHKGVEPAMSLPSQCLPRAGAPATDFTPCASAWFV